VYAFADASGEALAAWAEWMSTSSTSPLRRHTPAGADADAVFDVKAIYSQAHEEVDVTEVPALFRPRTGPLALMDWE
jgi:phenol 2-monooxygenase